MPDRQDDLNPASDLAPFADALKRLAPQPAQLSRDALLFDAGKAAAGSAFPLWVWPTATATFAAIALVLAAFLVMPDPPAIEYRDQVVYIPQPAAERPVPGPAVHPPPVPKSAPATSADDPEKTRMMQVRRDVLRWGLDMLPEPRSDRGGRSEDVTAREVTRWLNLPPGTFALPALQPKKPAPKIEEDDE